MLTRQLYLDTERMSLEKKVICSHIRGEVQNLLKEEENLLIFDEMVLILQQDYQEWKALHRTFGALFDNSNQPSGQMYLRFQVSDSVWIYWV